MSPQLEAFFDHLQASYAAARCAADAMEPAKRAFRNYVQQCGIEFCNYGCFEIGPDGYEMAAFSDTNMSATWIDEYMERGFYADDYVMRGVEKLSPQRPIEVMRFGAWTVPQLAEDEARSGPVLLGAADAGMEDAIGMVGRLPHGGGEGGCRYFAFGFGGDRGSGEHALARIAELRVAAAALMERLRPEFEALFDGVAAQLTPREYDVLALAAEGEQREGVANRLGISVPTVDLHLANARRRLNAATTAEAVARAHRYGLLARAC
jgi:DNA-binding CsgD family transcriptional regulator